MTKTPATHEEWQQAADTASLMLHIDSARKYGLVTSGPSADIRRCEELLRGAKGRGIEPRLIDELLAEAFS